VSARDVLLARWKQLAWPAALKRRLRVRNTGACRVHGAGPSAGLPGRGALAYGPSETLRRVCSPPQSLRGVRTPGHDTVNAWRVRRARATRRRRCLVPVFIRFGPFQIVKLKILEWNLKISKYESCREIIGLQLLQKGDQCFGE
jgi:hypothetical protein